MREFLVRMMIGGFLSFVTLATLPILFSMTGDGSDRELALIESTLRLAAMIKWAMLALGIASLSGLTLSIFLSGDYSLTERPGDTSGSRQKTSATSEKSALLSKLKIITKQIEKVNSYLDRNDLPVDQRQSLVSALAFLSKQKAFIDFRFIALDQLEWESKVRDLYSRMEASTGTDDATINTCREYLAEISTGCEDRLRKLDALGTESVTDTPETSRAARELRERVEEIERITSENRRHLQSREIADTLGEIRQLEAGESNIENEIQGAIPVRFITGNFEPLDTEVMFQKMRIESLKELAFPDAPDENQKLF